MEKVNVDMGIDSEGVHKEGRQRDVVKRRMERRIERVDLGPGDRLEARDRSTRLLGE